MRIQYIGHATISIETSMKIITDPCLKGKGRKEGLSVHNPKAALSVEDVAPDLILLTHGHGDHFGQTFELLEKTDAQLVASNRVCDFVKKKFDEKRLLRIEPGETLKIGGITVSAQKAAHRYGLEGLGGDILGVLIYRKWTPCGPNMGYLISAEGKKIYHSGDTCTIGNVHNPDVAFLSMDGARTLNEHEVVEAIKRIAPKVVIPIHHKWIKKGKKTMKKVKEAIEHEKINVLFKEMEYGEVLDV